MRLSRAIVAVSVLVGVAAAGEAALPREYQLLREKSIFSRERTRRAFSGPTTTVVAPPSLPVLVGIIQEEYGQAAIFEVPGSGRSTPIHPGESLPGGAGIAMEITLDHVEYAPSPDAPVKRVEIGRSLDGSESTLAATTQPATTDTPVEGEDIVARMKRRRQQELGK